MAEGRLCHPEHFDPEGRSGPLARGAHKKGHDLRRVLFCGLRRPQGGSTLQDFNARGGRAAPAPRFCLRQNARTAHPRRRPEGRLGSSLSRVCIIVRISNIHFNRPFYKKGTVWHCAEQYLFLWTLWKRQNRFLPSLGRSSGRSERPCGSGVFGSPVFNRLF